MSDPGTEPMHSDSDRNGAAGRDSNSGKEKDAEADSVSHPNFVRKGCLCDSSHPCRKIWSTACRVVFLSLLPSWP
jgi:hypothetical protein